MTVTDEKSILEMVGGENHINPHYNIKEESTSCNLFTGTKIVKEMPKVMNKQESSIEELEKQLIKAKDIILGLLIILRETATDEYDFEKACPYQYEEAKVFLGKENN